MNNNNTLLLLFCILSSSAVVYSDGNAKIFDITHKITSQLPTFNSQKGLGHFIWLVSSIKNGSMANESEFKLGTHTGTHVDAPSHFFQKYYEEGFDVSTLSLQTLTGPVLVVDVPRNKNITGPVLVVDVPRNKNITAEVMKSLNIPRGVHRVLFKTLNTDRRLMHRREFASDFTGFKKDGAQWLVDNTDIKLVGIDYLSISAYVDAAPTHHILLKSREIVIVEGLNLDGIKPGKYTVHCLPLRMVGADGCPTRCILTA
ncbi:Kynurenine formamidase [Gossypium arboreum]|uniref:Kynurenine formamidase n=2 Tax=Gossypium arboreum TaxID=29729 RepID=A0A0B0PD97_GOSAR|nr:hypothetical protein PVK06_046734 [Gossypium arboreum]KHG22907.1 Kynurenine formamidase [Gossypium arboreum]